MNLEIVYMDYIEYLSHHFPVTRLSKNISLTETSHTSFSLSLLTKVSKVNHKEINWKGF